MDNEEIQTILYKNEFQITSSLMLEFMNKIKIVQIFRITASIIGIIFITYSMTFFWHYFNVMKDKSTINSAIENFIFGIIFVLAGYIGVYVSAKKSVKLIEMARKNNPEASKGVTFYNEVIKAVKNKIEYNQIKKIILSKNLLIQQGDNFGDGYIEGKQAKYIILKKDAFTIGSEKEFLEFLMKKTKIKL